MCVCVCVGVCVCVFVCVCVLLNGNRKFYTYRFLCSVGQTGSVSNLLCIQTKTTTTTSAFKTDGINNAIILAGWGWQCYCPKLKLIVYFLIIDRNCSKRYFHY